MWRHRFISLYKVSIRLFSRPTVRRIRLVRWLHAQIVAWLRTEMAEVQGHLMYLDPGDALRLSIFGIYEPVKTRLIHRLVQPGHVVVDIGAHVGYYTLLFARLVGKHGHVYAFEPEPSNFALLRKNIEINGYRNVTLISKAVSNATGQAHLYCAKSNTGDHRLYGPEAARVLTVETVRLDDFFDSNQRINLIKMDIQGAEGLALRGMCHLIDRNPAIEIITEFWPAGLRLAGTDPREFLAFFADRGFTIYEVAEDQGDVRKVTPTDLLHRYPPARNSSLDFTDLWITRRWHL